VRIAAGVAPQDGAGLVRKLARKRPVDPDESVANEMLAVGITERVHRLRLTASHNVLAGFVGLDSGDCRQAELATLIVADNLC